MDQLDEVATARASWLQQKNILKAEVASLHHINIQLREQSLSGIEVGVGSTGPRGKETDVGEDEIKVETAREEKHTKGRSQRVGITNHQDDDEEDDDEEDEGSEEEDEDVDAIERAFLTEYHQVIPPPTTYTYPLPHTYPPSLDQQTSTPSQSSIHTNRHCLNDYHISIQFASMRYIVPFFSTKYYHNHVQENENDPHKISHKTTTKQTRTATSHRRSRSQNEENKLSHLGLNSNHISHLTNAARRAIEKAMFDTICAFSSAHGEKTMTSEEFKFRLFLPETITTTGTYRHPDMVIMYLGIYV